MRTIFILVSILVFSSCARYKYLPRATVKNTSFSKSTNYKEEEASKDLKTGVTGKKVISIGSGPDIPVIKHQLIEKNSVLIQAVSTPAPASKISNYIYEEPKDPPLNDSSDHAKKLKSLGNTTMMFGILTIPGLIIFVLPGIVFGILFLIYLSRYMKLNREMKEKGGIADNSPAPGKKATKAKSVKEPTSKLNYIFFYLLIANVIIWVLANWNNL